jgi:hypothetical protein
VKIPGHFSPEINRRTLLIRAIITAAALFASPAIALAGKIIGKG